VEAQSIALLTLIITELAGLAALWIKVNQTRRKVNTNGHAVSQAGARLNLVRDELLRMIEQQKHEMDVLKADRDQWQLRALQCEERMRSQ
jgi:hypothetical protein